MKNSVKGFGATIIAPCWTSAILCRRCHTGSVPVNEFMERCVVRIPDFEAHCIEVHAGQSTVGDYI